MNWQSTKFWHAMFVQIVSAVALFTNHLGPETWLGVSTIALGIYAVADVAQKKVQAGG